MEGNMAPTKMDMYTKSLENIYNYQTQKFHSQVKIT